MNSSRISYYITVIIACVTFTNLSADMLKDPRTRNEDISDTTVNVTVNHLSNGFYEYLYQVDSSVNNKGRILSFKLDISCNTSMEPVSFPESLDEDFTDASTGNHHVPVQVYSTWGQAVLPGITVDNRASWAIARNPGTQSNNIRLLSSAAPGERQYTLTPSMDTEGWDYGTYQLDDPTVPWIPDFTVTGTTTGPACLGQEYSFPGSSAWGREPVEVNELLTYSEPKVDQFHVSKGTGNIAMTINYADNIDPKSFKVEPGYLRNYFHPTPGESESVSLPIKKNINLLKIKLDVRAIRVNKGKDKVDLDKMKDTDVFTIHVDK